MSNPHDARSLLQELRVMQQQRDRAIDLILDNGDVEGTHHKQWVLDQIARVLCGPDRYRHLFGSENWDRGIAP